MPNNKTEQINGALAHCQQLLNEQDYASLIILTERLSVTYSMVALIHFYKGYAQQQRHLVQPALRSYDSCLDLDPQCAAAWQNKAQLLHKLQRRAETNFHLVKYLRLAIHAANTSNDNATDLASDLVTNTEDLPKNDHVLAAATGQFGEISVLQNSNTRYLTINNEREGSFWLVDDQLSNIPASDYVYGFLLAGCHFNASHSATSGLILGLGAGAGVIALLANFDQLSLSVVEIDPTLIDMACLHFPLLAHYIECGRLTLICQDAFDYVEKQQGVQPGFDFALLDIYQGDHQFQQRLTSSLFLSGLRRMADLIGVNIMTPKDQYIYQQNLRDFEQGGVRFKSCYPTGYKGDRDLPFQNRILYSQVIKPINDFTPYANDNSYLRRPFGRDFNQVLVNAQQL